jgi:hypothetical protein
MNFTELKPVHDKIISVGYPKKHFHPYLKEIEWLFNNKNKKHSNNS